MEFNSKMMENFKNGFIALVVGLLAFGMNANAQKKTMFVSATSSVHPYERTQWTEKVKIFEIRTAKTRNGDDVCFLSCASVKL